MRNITQLQKYFCTGTTTQYFSSRPYFDGKHKVMMDRVKYDLNITLECVRRGEHVPEAEIKIVLLTKYS